MRTAIAAVMYLLLHMLFYALCLRRMAIFRTEKGIFLMHLCSFILVSLTVSAFAVSGAEAQPLAAAVAVISLHGIYSVSFLELWSLAQGSYSLQILESALHGVDTSGSGAIVALTGVGDQKRANRMRALEDLGLIRHTLGGIELTATGRACCLFFRAISWTANLRSVG